LSYRDLNNLKALQAIASLMMFLFPAIGFLMFKRYNVGQYLKMGKFIQFLPLLLVPLMLLSIYPILNVLMEWNGAIKFPEFLREFELGLMESEEQAALMTGIFLQMHHWADLIVNLFVIAVIPAFVEEILFRGVLQQVIEKGTKNPHLAIWIAGAAFSAIHFQFYGFLGRWALGVWLGYLFYWSRNLWYPIIAHLFNNGILVVLIYFKVVEPPTFPAESPEMPIWQVGIAALFFIACMLAFQNLVSKRGQRV